MLHVHRAERADALVAALRDLLAEPLSDPFAPDVTLERDFLALPRLGGILTDQHLQERDRIGCTLVLLARIMAEGWSASPR